MSFGCPPGTITGLLGPNGSGKSTIMRLITGLSRSDHGDATFDGTRYRDLRDPGKEVGVLLDPSAHHRGRTVQQTIGIAAAMIGVAEADAHRVLESMGLAGIAKRPFGRLSLGMQQRLGMAIAIIGNPRFLILDEPMNGLDVESARWLREMIIAFSHTRGGTVLISSHLLQELQAYADRYVVISEGRVVAESTAADLTVAEHCEVTVRDAGSFTVALRGRGVEFEELDQCRFRVNASSATVGTMAIENRILITALIPGGSRALEGFYLSSTNGELPIPTAGGPR